MEPQDCARYLENCSIKAKQKDVNDLRKMNRKGKRGVLLSIKADKIEENILQAERIVNEIEIKYEK